MNKFAGILGICLLAGSSFFYYGCSSSSSSSSNNPGSLANRPETITYSGPGSFYTSTLNNDGTCEVEIREMHTDEDPVFTVECEFEPLDNGVLDITVTGVTPDDLEDGPTVGGKAYGVEVVGFGLFLLPQDGNEIIPMLTAGTCPEADYSANWLIAQGGGDDDTTDEERDFFGTFAYDVSENTAEVTSKNALTDGFPNVALNEEESIEGTCEDGLISLTEDDDPVALLFLTENGGAIVQTFEENEESEEFETASSIVAFPPDADATIADLEGTFHGILFQGGGEDENNDNEDVNNFFVEMTFDDAGAGTGREVTQINPWETGEDAATISLEESAIGDGWFTGTLDVEGEASANLACSYVGDVEGTTVDALLCIGQSPGDLANENESVGAINFLMVRSE